LKPSFNKSGQSCRSAPRKAFRAAEVAKRKQQGRVMTTITSGSFSSPADSRSRPSSPLAEIRAFWLQFVARVFDPYRPELHYMRGPGPAWRAKQVPPSHPHSA
jgi:hypothetical protein